MQTPKDCTKNYGVPLYAVAWIPRPRAISDQIHHQQNEDASPSPLIDSRSYLVLAGGGGHGYSGDRNTLIIPRFDSASYSLSDQYVAQVDTGAELPYRMAVHPSGAVLICSVGRICELYEVAENAKGHGIGMRLSPKALTQLADVGQQLAMTFNDEGSLLALGGEKGDLRVFKWPSMEIVIDEPCAHATVKDLDFSPDGKLLVSSGSGGPCIVWDVASSTVLASLPKEDDEIFGFCRFSQGNSSNLVLYTTVTRDKGGSIITWNTETWTRDRLKQVVRDSICAFGVSPDGKSLAVGTVQGDVLIINSANMQPCRIVKEAHIGFVTGLAFSHDSRALASVSMDSSVRVTTFTKERKLTARYNLRAIAFGILLAAIAAYAFKSLRIISST